MDDGKDTSADDTPDESAATKEVNPASLLSFDDTEAALWGVLSRHSVAALACSLIGLIVGVSAIIRYTEDYSYDPGHGGIYVRAALLIFCLVTPALAWIDQKTLRLPDIIIKPLAAVVFALLLTDAVVPVEWGGGLGWDLLGKAVLGGFCAVLLFFGIALGTAGGLGLGDVKYVGIAVTLIGLKSLLVASTALLVIAPLLTIVFIIPMVVKHQRAAGRLEAQIKDALRRDVAEADELESQKESLGRVRVAYGPFLIAASLAALALPADWFYFTG